MAMIDRSTDPEIECVDCGWQGWTLDLHRKTDDPDDNEFKYCPTCAGGDIESIEYDDED